MRPVLPHRIFRAGLGAPAGALGGGVRISGAEAASTLAGEFVVRAAEPRQIIEGFGASGCWWAQEVGNWPAATLVDETRSGAPLRFVPGELPELPALSVVTLVFSDR